jgi:hypothetical protein
MPWNIVYSVHAYNVSAPFCVFCMSIHWRRPPPSLLHAIQIVANGSKNEELDSLWAWPGVGLLRAHRWRWDRTTHLLRSEGGVTRLFYDHKVGGKVSKTNVGGRSLSIASISVTIVWSSDSWIAFLPSTFFRASFVRPISRSQNPPYQGARLTMNFHYTDLLLRSSWRSGDLKSRNISSAADW